MAALSLLLRGRLLWAHLFRKLVDVPNGWLTLRGDSDTQVSNGHTLSIYGIDANSTVKRGSQDLSAPTLEARDDAEVDLGSFKCYKNSWFSAPYYWGCRILIHEFNNVAQRNNAIASKSAIGV